MTEYEVRSVADHVLSESLAVAGFDRAEVRLGADHDGDASFFVTAHFKPGSGTVGGERWMSVHTALWTHLLASGEERFPYLEMRYADDEVLSDDDQKQAV